MDSHPLVVYAALRGLRLWRYEHGNPNFGWRIAMVLGGGLRAFYTVRGWEFGGWNALSRLPKERQWHELPPELADKLTQELLDSLVS